MGRDTCLTTNQGGQMHLFYVSIIYLDLLSARFCFSLFQSAFMSKTHVHHIIISPFSNAPRHSCLSVFRDRLKEEGARVPVQVLNAQLGSGQPRPSRHLLSLESPVSRRCEPCVLSTVDIMIHNPGCRTESSAKLWKIWMPRPHP